MNITKITIVIWACPSPQVAGGPCTLCSPAGPSVDPPAPWSCCAVQAGSRGPRTAHSPSWKLHTARTQPQGAVHTGRGGSEGGRKRVLGGNPPLCQNVFKVCKRAKLVEDDQISTRKYHVVRQNELPIIMLGHFKVPSLSQRKRHKTSAEQICILLLWQ